MLGTSTYTRLLCEVNEMFCSLFIFMSNYCAMISYRENFFWTHDGLGLFKHMLARALHSILAKDDDLSEDATTTDEPNNNSCFDLDSFLFHNNPVLLALRAYQARLEILSKVRNFLLLIRCIEYLKYYS